MQLNHVALTVSNRAASAAFYREAFGLTEPIVDDDHMLILADTDRRSILAMWEGDSLAGALPRTNHFGFQADSPDEVYAARERFRHSGLTESEWQDDPGMVRVQLLDPDGYRVELYAFR